MKACKEMTQVVHPTCGHPEYYGMVHWTSGRTLCRACTYELWEQESKWKRNPKTNFTFPIYEDGIDYDKGATK